MNRLRSSLIFLALFLAPGIPSALAAEGPFQATQIDRGTKVELSIKNAFDPAAALKEGQAAQFTLTLRDETTGSTVNGAFPNMWMLRYRPVGDDEPKRCNAAVASLLTGGLSSPSALDLNVYYVLTLNSDGSINVVDPHFSFGGSQLLGMVELDHPGYDWVLASGGDRLFVTVPASNRVAVIDSVHWKIERYIDAGPNPRRILAAADGRQLWVATDKGVSVIRASDAVGPGRHRYRCGRARHGAQR